MLYPDGQVFSTVNAGGLLGLLDKITYALFVGGLQGHYTDSTPMFPTLRMDDDRLPAQEQIWGINLGGEQVGFTQNFVQQHPIYNTVIGDIPIVIERWPPSLGQQIKNHKCTSVTININLSYLL